MNNDRVVEYVLKTMHGENGSKVATLHDVAAAVADSAGDYLEIGTFCGASAIVAALVKIENNSPSLVYCVDPFGFEHQEPVVIEKMKLTETSARKIENAFVANINLFGLRDKIVHIKKPSSPWPAELAGKRFGCVLVDGWHYDETPLSDVTNAMAVTDNRIVLDDVVLHYPAIMRAYEFIKASSEWVELRRSIHAVTFGKAMA